MRTVREKQNDIKLGANGENRILPKIEKYFNEPMFKDSYVNAVLDFYNEAKTIFVELKTRRIVFGTYPDIIIGQNKLNHFNALNVNNDKKFYFIVSAYNGDYIAEINCDNDYRKWGKEFFVSCEDFVKF